MDEVYPASYSIRERAPEFLRAGFRTLNPFSSVPTFYNRLPKWARKYNPIDRQARIENQARWVGVSEKEVPRVVTFDNADGTVGFRQVREGAILPDANKIKLGKTVKDYDFVFGPGGEHSYFTLVHRSTSDMPGNIWVYEDEQIINPQWILADKLKQAFGISIESRLGRIIDWFGKKDLKSLIGFNKDVKYKQYLWETYKGIFPLPNDQVEKMVK